MACDLLVVAIVPLLIATWLIGDRSREALASEARQNFALLAGVTATRLDQLFAATVAPGALLVALGDVSGHGVASALLMASARAALRAAVSEGAGLAGLLTRVNRVLSTDARHGRFMTMILASIDARARTVRWASAGHDPIIIYEPARDAFIESEGGDMPLGIARDVEYEEYHQRDLEVGTTLLMGTDGIWESRNAHDEMFGKERLREIIRAYAASGAKATAEAIDAALKAFRGAVRAHDDVTYVVIRLKSEYALARADPCPLQQRPSFKAAAVAECPYNLEPATLRRSFAGDV